MNDLVKHYIVPFAYFGAFQLRRIFDGTAMQRAKETKAEPLQAQCLCLVVTHSSATPPVVVLTSAVRQI